MKNKEGFSRVAAILIAVAIIIIAGGLYLFASKTPATNDQTAREATSTGNFSSSALGVSFSYDPQAIAVRVDGSTINVDSASGTTGDSLQVFDKAPAVPITQAIQSLNGISGCNLTVNDDTNGYPALQQDGWQVYSVSGQNRPANGCDTYTNPGSPGFFFLYKTISPSKFAFWKGGAALNTDQVLATLQFTQ